MIVPNDISDGFQRIQKPHERGVRTTEVEESLCYTVRQSGPAITGGGGYRAVPAIPSKNNVSPLDALLNTPI